METNQKGKEKNLDIMATFTDCSICLVHTPRPILLILRDCHKLKEVCDISIIFC